MTFQVNEIFDSFQGEGFWTGIPATFIRLQGCTVGCAWCDSGPRADDVWGRQTNGMTRNTWGRGGTRMNVSDIIDLVHHRHVVITGGEPVLYDLDPIIRGLRNNMCFIQLETSGLNWLKGKLLPDWITWSPKENLKWTASIEYYRHAREIKFVVDPKLSYEVIRTLIEAVPKLDRRSVHVAMMPEGCPPSRDTMDFAMNYVRRLEKDIPQVHARFCDRMQYRVGIR